MNHESRTEAFNLFKVDEENDEGDNVIILDDSSDEDTIEENNIERNVGTAGEEHPLIKVEVGAPNLPSDDENPDQESETDEDESVSGKVYVHKNPILRL